MIGRVTRASGWSKGGGDLAADAAAAEFARGDVASEGIETKEQARYLTAQGCDFGQAFLYAKAMAAAQVPKLIECWHEREERHRRDKTQAALKLVSSR